MIWMGILTMRNENYYDLNAFTGNLVFWCPDCGTRFDTDHNSEMEKCPNCEYDGCEGWELSPISKR